MVIVARKPDSLVFYVDVTLKKGCRSCHIITLVTGMPYSSMYYILVNFETISGYQNQFALVTRVSFFFVVSFGVKLKASFRG